MEELRATILRSMSVCTASKMQFVFVTAVAKDMRIKLHDLKLRFVNDRSSRALGFIAVNCHICFFATVLRSSSS